MILGYVRVDTADRVLSLRRHTGVSAAPGPPIKRASALGKTGFKILIAEFPHKLNRAVLLFEINGRQVHAVEGIVFHHGIDSHITEHHAAAGTQGLVKACLLYTSLIKRRRAGPLMSGPEIGKTGCSKS